MTDLAGRLRHAAYFDNQPRKLTRWGLVVAWWRFHTR
jgi:hypothetical protein